MSKVAREPSPPQSSCCTFPLFDTLAPLVDHRPMNLLGSISVGAGAAANNKSGAARASLNLATKTTHDDSVVEAVDKGTAGNAITIAFMADGVGKVSITSHLPQKTIVVHFVDGVSTVLDVEKAIAALVVPINGNPLLRVKTAGTPGNVLHATVDEFAATALAGGVGFSIPPAVNSLFLQSDTDGVQFELGAGDTFETTAARGVFIPAG